MVWRSCWLENYGGVPVASGTIDATLSFFDIARVVCGHGEPVHVATAELELLSASGT